MSTISGLAEVSAAIHDECFNIERLDHQAEQAELRVPICAAQFGFVSSSATFTEWHATTYWWATTPYSASIEVAMNLID